MLELSLALGSQTVCARDHTPRCDRPVEPGASQEPGTKQERTKVLFVQPACTACAATVVLCSAHACAQPHQYGRAPTHRCRQSSSMPTSGMQGCLQLPTACSQHAAISSHPWHPQLYTWDAPMWRIKVVACRSELDASGVILGKCNFVCACKLADVCVV